MGKNLWYVFSSDLLHAVSGICHHHIRAWENAYNTCNLQIKEQGLVKSPRSQVGSEKAHALSHMVLLLSHMVLLSYGPFPHALLLWANAQFVLLNWTSLTVLPSTNVMCTLAFCCDSECSTLLCVSVRIMTYTQKNLIKHIKFLIKFSWDFFGPAY